MVLRFLVPAAVGTVQRAIHSPSLRRVILPSPLQLSKYH
jgi:hypothetical protein